MEKIITLTFENTNNEYYDLKFKTDANLPKPVFDLWYKKFVQFINDSSSRVQTRYSAFDLPGRDRKFLVNKLESVIHTINTSWLGTEYGYHIEDTTIPEDYPVEVHNRVHHHFEMLIGQLWDHSNWWKLVMDRGDLELGQTICCLNEITHELEESTDGTPPHIHMLFVFDKGEYSELDNEELPHEVSQTLRVGSIPGGIYINYSQTGKTIMEVLNDDDEEIFEDNITTHRLCNGSISISLGGTINSKEDEVVLLNRYKVKAEERGIDLSKPEFKLGRPYIGQIITEDIYETYQKLREFNTLRFIEIDGIHTEVDSFNDRV